MEEVKVKIQKGTFQSIFAYFQIAFFVVIGFFTAYNSWLTHK
jgi:hypothetical protein